MPNDLRRIRLLALTLVVGTLCVFGCEAPDPAPVVDPSPQTQLSAPPDSVIDVRFTSIGTDSCSVIADNDSVNVQQGYQVRFINETQTRLNLYFGPFVRASSGPAISPLQLNANGNNSTVTLELASWGDAGTFSYYVRRAAQSCQSWDLVRDPPKVIIRE